MDDRSAPPADSGAAPFVVAVSGHRDLLAADREAVAAAILDTLTRIASALPDTVIACMSPLADGADQLFAAQVLLLRQQMADPSRVRLLVPLPMALDAYCVAQGGADVAGFQHRIAPFLQQADSVYIVPDAPVPGKDIDPENRPYAVLARHLALHSHALLAVWDGASHPLLRGGTADVVQKALHGQARRHDGDSSHWLAEPDDALVLHVPCRRAGAQGAPVDATVRVLTGAGEQPLEAALAAAGAELDALNRRHRLALAAPEYAARLARARGALLASLGLADDAGTLAPLAHAFAIADVQAERAKRVWRRSWIAIALAAVLAGSSSLLRLLSEEYGELIETLSFGAGAVIAIGVYLWIARAGERNAYLAYRALAEGLRVQMAWLAAGSTALVSDYYLRKQRDDVGWVRQAIDALAVRPHNAPRPAASVLRGWIADQLVYLRGPHIARREREQLRAARWGHWLLLAGLACAIAGVALSVHHGTVGSWTMLLIIIAMKLLTDLGAAWVSFNGKMAHAETLHQVTHQRAMYERAAAALDQIAAQGEDAGELLLALGRDVLEENANWMRLYRERRLAWHGR